MQSMPKYWNSPYYNRKTNVLSDEAPEELKKEFQEFNTKKEEHGIVILY